MTGMKHGNTKPMVCGVWGKEISAGTGLFLAAADGSVVGFVYGGRCAYSRGVYPGGSVAFGEITELTSAMLAGGKPTITGESG